MAVSLLHEGLLELVRDRPAFVAELLTQVLDVPVPKFAEARLTDTTLNQLVPVEYHADAVVLLVEGKPVFGVITEAQLQRDDRKLYTWPLYGVSARAHHECPFVVLVVTTEADVARWASRPIHLGGGVFQPHVIGPENTPKLTDPAQAARFPQLAVLSVAAHGHGDVETAVQIALAASEAVKTMPSEDQRVLYFGLIEQALSKAAAEIFKMQPQAHRWMSDSQRQSYDRGEAKGEAKALLRILVKRGLVVSAEQELRISECTDIAALDRWLECALSVVSVDELLG